MDWPNINDAKNSHHSADTLMKHKGEKAKGKAKKHLAGECSSRNVEKAHVVTTTKSSEWMGVESDLK